MQGYLPGKERSYKGFTSCPILRFQCVGAGAHGDLGLQVQLQRVEDQRDLPALVVIRYKTVREVTAFPQSW